MSKFLLCAALLLALSGSALSGSIRIVVAGKAANPATRANVVAGNAPNPATRANDVAKATDGKQPAVAGTSVPSVCSNSKSPSTAVASSSSLRFKAELSGLKNIRPNTTGEPQLQCMCFFGGGAAGLLPSPGRSQLADRDGNAASARTDVAKSCKRPRVRRGGGGAAC